MSYRPPSKPAGMWQSAYNAAPKPPKPAGMWTSAADHYGFDPQHSAPTGGKAPNSQAVPSPFDSTYESSVATLGANRDRSLAGVTAGEGQDARDYGFNLHRDAAGNVDSWTQDTSNPFSKMSLLQRAYEQNVKGTTNDYAAQGQQYAGSLANAQNENLFQQQHGQSDLSSEFSHLISGHTGDRTNIQNDYGSGVSDAAWTKLLALLQGGA